MALPVPFLPAVERWFASRFAAPSPPQAAGWPVIRGGKHTLITAPTGTGKTLAAFLCSVDDLLREGDASPDSARVLYLSPLKALANDVQKNLSVPLAGIRAIDPSLPAIGVMVRSGDTPASGRAAMLRRPPHILVTTPESLAILLTSGGGRGLLGGVRRVIVDEIHALAGDKRGSHLALSLERLEALTGGGLQRIGLSATVRPLERVARFLAGEGRACTIVDAGQGRHIDLAVEIPSSPLETVCSHETWGEVYGRMAELIRAHRTTLVFVNTRKLAERVAARLGELLGADTVTSHHGSLARQRRLLAEDRLKKGELRALVATASLELGIDVGDVDLVVQVGVTPSISLLLQRAGRSGHALARLPKARLFPLTIDELITAAALTEAAGKGILDEIREPAAPLDILAQQIVSACVPETWSEDELFALCRRAHPYRDLTRAEFDAVVGLHTGSRLALLHRDGVHGRLRATRRARLIALTSGGAIPDAATYQVVLEPEGTPIGTLDEDFAIESDAGDIFQLGAASWRILKIEPGTVRVADAAGAPPTLPFWLGEGPARTLELSEAVGRARQRAVSPRRDGEAGSGDWPGLPAAALAQIQAHLAEGAAALGAVPTPRLIVAERFFDESGGMQLVLHACLGSRINKAWGLALRKRFCRAFGFELQAAANEDALVLSLGPRHSFPLAEVFSYLHPETVRDLLAQAVLPTPLFTARWRWNVSRALLLPRTGGGGKRVPPYLLRLRAADLLADAFPQVLACAETLPGGDLPIPWENPLVRQTMEDCLTEALDVEGLIAVLRRIRAGEIRTLAVDLSTPSTMARGVLAVKPYGFLDDAPLEERRTQAVMTRRLLEPRAADAIGALHPAAVEQVARDAWPQPASAEEVHEALQWMGYVTREEAARGGWEAWLGVLADERRVTLEGDRWRTADASRDPERVLVGRLEALGPVRAAGRDGAAAPGGQEAPSLPLLDTVEAAHLPALEAAGLVLRCRLAGQEAWCHRRLLARIHAATLERLRHSIQAVSAARFWRFLVAWQRADPETMVEGPGGVRLVLDQLAGFEAPARAWEASILPARVRGYQREWLDTLTLGGEYAWLRLWGSAVSPLRSTPIAFVPGAELEFWRELSRRGMAGPASAPAAAPSGAARLVAEILGRRGASFRRQIAAGSSLLPSQIDAALAELIALGMVTGDSFAGLRALLGPGRPRRRPGTRRATSPFDLQPAGRWSLLAAEEERAAPGGAPDGSPPPKAPAAEDEAAERVGRLLLRRYGIVFRRLVVRERLPIPWRDLLVALRRLELRGEIRGGRFVTGFSGEQFALPEAIEQLRRERDSSPAPERRVSAADPLNLRGVLTPEERIPPQARRAVLLP